MPDDTDWELPEGPTQDGTLAGLPDDGPDNVEGAVPEGRPCKAPGCMNRLPLGAGGRRRFCDDHQPGKSTDNDRPPPAPTDGAAKAATATATSTRRGSKAAKADELERVQNNAKFLFSMIAGATEMAAQARGSVILHADALDIERGSDTMALATRNLAAHEAWLRKLLAGGEASERAMAWIGFLMVVGPVVGPILIRHKVIPGEMLGMVTPPAVADGAAVAA
jgi:hypothetical protein